MIFCIDICIDIRIDICIFCTFESADEVAPEPGLLGEGHVLRVHIQVHVRGRGGLRGNGT